MPSLAIRLGLVVTPSKMPRSATSLISSRFAVSRKNFMRTKVIAQVPFLYPNVKDFCLKNGFVVEGINRLSHQKDGVIVDQWLLGITRDEIEEGLKT